MKVTKLTHSCLLAESSGKRILADPGVYSWQSGTVKPEHLSELDAVVVTHGHPDHLNQDFVEAIAKHSPAAIWYGPEQVAGQLKSWGVTARTSSPDPAIKFIDSEHADLSPWFDQQPDHTSYLLFDELLLGGDCHTLTENHGARIFGGAVNGGPWGSVLGFAKMIEAMESRPQIVLPLHDWHWNEDARKGIYSQLPEVMGKFGVKFVPLKEGASTEV